MDGTEPILSVRGLSVAFPSPHRRRKGPPDTGDGAIPTVRDVSFDVRRGEFAALVGESGCGKSLTAMAIMRLPPTDGAVLGGSVRVAGREVLSLPARELRTLRGRMVSYVFQDPSSSLNPVLAVRTQLREALPRGLSQAEAEHRLRTLLETVRVPDPERILRAYPHELSGGLQQRVGIAMAAAADPALLVADEPTTALDATTQRSVLELLDRLRRERGIALLLITHNLGIVARHADNVHVMYAGEIVESGPADTVLRTPAHPYTRGLLGAVPALDLDGLGHLHGIPGRVPPPEERGEGCAFAPRCERAEEECHAPAARTPRPVGANRTVRCRRLAFTLLETLTVLLILSLLAGLTVGQIRLAKVRRDEAHARAELALLGHALEQYRAAFDEYPPSVRAEGDTPDTVAVTNILAWTHAPAWILSDGVDDTFCLGNFLPSAEQQRSISGFSGLDPWNHPYWYRHDPEAAPDSYLLYSQGPTATTNGFGPGCIVP